MQNFLILVYFNYHNYLCSKRFIYLSSKFKARAFLVFFSMDISFISMVTLLRKLPYRLKQNSGLFVHSLSGSTLLEYVWRHKLMEFLTFRAKQQNKDKKNINL